MVCAIVIIIIISVVIRVKECMECMVCERKRALGREPGRQDRSLGRESSRPESCPNSRIKKEMAWGAPSHPLQLVAHTFAIGTAALLGARPPLAG